jgi:hypothetical protein
MQEIYTVESSKQQSSKDRERMDIMIKQYAFLSLFILVGLTALPAQATTITTFSDKAAFLGFTGATSATGALPNLGGPIPGGLSPGTTVGSVTFTIAAPSAEFFMGTLGWEYLWAPLDPTWTPLLPGNSIAIDGVENLNAALASPVFAYGFDFVEPSNSTFTVTLQNSGATVGSFTFNAPKDVAAFVGVQSSSAFNRVEIRETIGGISNEFFGQVYTATTLVQNPEPSTVLLMGMGSGALLLWGRYRRKRNV